MSMQEAEFGELGEFGETEFGELGEFGETEYGETEFGETEYGETEFGETEYGETEFGETEFGELGEFGETEYGELGETEAETEQFLGGLVSSILGEVGEYESPLSEVQEVQLAQELLEITSEQELEQFLGKLFKGVARKVGGFVRSPVGRALGGVLKGVAKKALPVVGGALGTMIAPGVGTMIGRSLGSAATRLFEVELGEMNQEQAEFEVARRFVGLAASAARNAALAPPRVNPKTVARAAVARAARTHAPGLYRGITRAAQPHARRLPGRPYYPRPAYRRRSPYAGIRAGGPRGYAVPQAGGLVPAAVAPGAVTPAALAAAGIAAPVATGMAGRWVRRGRKIVLYGA